MGPGKFGLGQIWVWAETNLALGKFGFRANLAGQTWAGQKWLETEMTLIGIENQMLFGF